MGRPMSNLCVGSDTAPVSIDGMTAAGRIGERKEMSARKAVLVHDLAEMVEEEEERDVAWGGGGMMDALQKQWMLCISNGCCKIFVV